MNERNKNSYLNCLKNERRNFLERDKYGLKFDLTKKEYQNQYRIKK